MNQTTKANQITCESCGKPFECGANLGTCWCFSVDLSQETLDNLRESFAKCLCQDCLLSQEKKQKIEVK